MTKQKNNEWNELAEEVDEQNIKQKVYDDVFIKFCSPDCKNKTILDYGCGTGDIAKRLESSVKLIEAYDESKEMRKSAIKKLGKVVYSNHNKIPRNKYDTVLSSLVLCVVNNREAKRIVKQVYNSLKSKGTAYIGFCNPLDFKIKETKLQFRLPTGDNYKTEHEYKKKIKIGDGEFFEMTDKHRPLEFYEGLFEKVGFKILKKKFSLSETIKGRKCSDFIIYKLKKQ
jgi:ubiquinone/menaquinone biosynthesis C-methylase UbiE